MAQAFEIGDLVRLKSGGPVMTVTYISQGAQGSAPKVTAHWFDSENQTFKNFDVNPLALVPAATE